ncbi:MAG: serine/threonine protein kinase [Chitinophagales bacterium]
MEYVHGKIYKAVLDDPHVTNRPPLLLRGSKPEDKARLGKGGQAVVYEMEDVKTSKVLAVKVLHESLIHEESIMTRFRNEATLGQYFRHTNLCSVYGLYTIEGIPCILMPKIEGIPLSDYFRRDKFDPHTIPDGEIPTKYHVDLDPVAFFAKLLDAIQVAHDMKVIHRDIKPSNIMVTAKGEPVVLDFGVARLDMKTEIHLTRMGLVVGSFSYMSPEQHEGRRADARSDIYSLGLLLAAFYLDEPIFTRHQTEGVIITKKREHLPDIFSKLKTARVPKKIREVIKKAIEPKAKNRFQSCTAFKEALTGEVDVTLWDTILGKTVVLEPYEQSAFMRYIHLYVFVVLIALTFTKHPIAGPFALLFVLGVFLALRVNDYLHLDLPKVNEGWFWPFVKRRWHIVVISVLFIGQVLILASWINNRTELKKKEKRIETLETLYE